MRFLVDECAGPVVAVWLRSRSHDVVSVYDDARGLSDDEILKRAFSENRILVTTDLDFGEMVYREKRPHHGVILLRLQNQNSASRLHAIEKLLSAYGDRIADAFVVVTESHVRFGEVP